MPICVRVLQIVSFWTIGVSSSCQRTVPCSSIGIMKNKTLSIPHLALFTLSLFHSGLVLGDDFAKRVEVGDKIYFINQDDKVYWIRKGEREPHQLAKVADGSLARSLESVRDITSFQGRVFALNGKDRGSTSQNLIGMGDLFELRGNLWVRVDKNVKQMLATKENLLSIGFHELRQYNGSITPYLLRGDDNLQPLSFHPLGVLGAQSMKKLSAASEDVEVSLNNGKKVLFSELQNAYYSVDNVEKLRKLGLGTRKESISGSGDETTALPQPTGVDGAPSAETPAM